MQKAIIRKKPKIFLNVYKYQKTKKDSIKLVKILNNIGTIYLDKNADSSLHYYQKAQLITDKLQNNTLTVYIYTNLARAYKAKKDKKNADLYFEKAFSLVESNIDNSLKSFVYESLSEYNMEENKFDDAIANAKKAFEFNKDKPFGFSNMRLNKMLYVAYLKKADYKNAVYYFQEYNKISDSINIEQKAVNLERIRLEQDYKVRSQIRTLVEEKLGLNIMLSD